MGKVKYKEYVPRRNILWITVPEFLREKFEAGVEIFQTDDDRLIVQAINSHQKTEGTQAEALGREVV